MERLPSLMVDKYYKFINRFVVTGKFCPIAPDKVSSTRYFLIDYVRIQHSLLNSAPLSGKWFDSWQDLVRFDGGFSFFEHVRAEVCDVPNDQFVVLFTDALDWVRYSIVLVTTVYYKKD